MPAVDASAAGAAGGREDLLIPAGAVMWWWRAMSAEAPGQCEWGRGVTAVVGAREAAGLAERVLAGPQMQSYAGGLQFPGD